MTGSTLSHLPPPPIRSSEGRNRPERRSISVSDRMAAVVECDGLDRRATAIRPLRGHTMCIALILLVCGCSGARKERASTTVVGETAPRGFCRVRIELAEEAVFKGTRVVRTTFAAGHRPVYSHHIHFKNAKTEDQSFSSFNIYVDGKAVAKFSTHWLDFGIFALDTKESDFTSKCILVAAGSHVLELKTRKCWEKVHARYEGHFDADEEILLTTRDFVLLKGSGGKR